MPTAVFGNYFNFAWVGNEIEMMIGFSDVVQLIQKRDALVSKGEGGEIVVKPEIVARIMMSPQAFEILRSQSDGIVTGLANFAASQRQAAATPPPGGSSES